MHVLFVHQNFPAQFRCTAPRLAADFGWECTFLTRNGKAPPIPGVRRLLYEPAAGGRDTPAAARPFVTAYGHAQGVYDAMKRHPEVKPDLVVAHSGFGSSAFLPYLYDCPIINFFEYFYRPVGQDLGYRPELPLTEEMLLRSPCRNAMILLDWAACTAGWCPNQSQRDLFPPELRQKIEVIPEGVDTTVYRRREGVKLRLLDGAELPPGTRVVTYVSRGFELMRGFDVFMKAAKLIGEQCPEAIFVVVGADQVYYGSEQALVKERTFGQHVLRSGRYDTSRFCFTGQVPESTLAEILSVSDVHIYLTAPFVTSWSLLDAMACGCVVLASDQACVREYVRHGENGLLCDFFDAEGIARQAADVLKNPSRYKPIRAAARTTIEEHYSLNASLPRIKRFFEEVAGRAHGASVVAERLIRPGTLGVGEAGSDRPRRGLVRPRAQSTGANVLFCWELGGGLGHMLPMLPIAEGLVKRGHRVFVALRTLSAAAAEVFGRAGVSFLQAPLKTAGPAPYRRTLGLPDLLANVGWGDQRELFVLGCGWRNLMEQVRPDFRVSILGGDATGDGRVNALDIAYIKQRLARSATSPSSGSAAYSVFADLNADGQINALDVAVAKQRLNRVLPTAIL